MSEIYEGNSITVNNINKSKAKIKNRGGSYQKTTQGKNLFDETKYSDDTLYSKGPGPIGSYFAYVKLPDSFKTKFYANVFLKGTIQNRLVIGFSDNNTSGITYRVYDKGSYFENKECDFTNAENVYFTIGNTDRVTIDTDVKTIFDNFNIMVTKKEDNIYEPYTGGIPSPNPNYPQEIQNDGDNINLYDKNNPNILNTPIDSNGTGVNVQNTYKTIWIPCKPNTTYTVSKIFDTTRNRFAVGYSSIEPNYSQAVEGYMSNEKANVLTVTTNTTAKYLLAYVWITGGSTTYEEMLDSIKIEEGTKATFYSNYNCGSVGVTISNKNIFNGFFTTNGVWKDDGTINYAIQSKLYWRTDFIKIPNKNIYFSSKQLNRFSSATLLEFDTDKKYITSNKIYQVNSNLNNVSLNENTRFIAIQWNLQNAAEIEGLFTDFQIEVGSTASPYISHQEQTIIFPLAEGQKLYEGSYLAADGIHNIVNETTINILEVIILSKNKNVAGVLSLKNKRKTIEDSPYGLCTKAKLSSSQAENTILENPTNFLIIGNKDDTLDTIKEKFNGATIQYKLDKEEIIPYTQEQQNAFYELQNIVLYDGINYISTYNELGSMSVEVSKIIEDYETYISSNGFFINSQNDIHYLIDFSESELPCMAEATETTVKAAGRNGDIVLSTTYDPNNFNIVCYTEDNLTQEEKVKEEMKLKKLLNSIKNKTIPLAFEKDDKFYKVKYSGAFSSTNFPKHLKFSIPLKTSESYGKDLIKKVIFGNGEETSDTFEDVGAIFTIKGPANSPIISLNDYSIEYDNPLLEGDKLIINSSNSTITHINSDGVATNAMRYYNHQFPKIENGKNVLKVLSGVNEANVSVEWYDYKF